MYYYTYLVCSLFYLQAKGCKDSRFSNPATKAQPVLLLGKHRDSLMRLEAL
jgi:hypothetical protein